jgi:hypothetical protein
MTAGPVCGRDRDVVEVRQIAQRQSFVLVVSGVDAGERRLY